MGRLHARALRAAPSLFTLVGGFDLDPSAPARLDLARLRSLDEAVAEAEVLVVATPIEAHAEPVLRALASGRDVFVEKPSGATFAEARTLVEMAERSGRRLFVGHSERFNPVVRAARKILGDEPVKSVALRRTAPSRAGRGGRLGGAEHAAGPRAVVLNLGVHDLDLAAYLTRGDRTLVAGPGKLGVLWARTSGDGADIAVRAGRAEARVHVARTSGSRERRLTLTTASMRLEGDLLEPRLDVTDLTTGETQRVRLGTEEPVVLQMRALAHALGQGFGPVDPLAEELATGVDGARAVLAVEQVASRLSEPRTEPALQSAENL